MEPLKSKNQLGKQLVLAFQAIYIVARQAQFVTLKFKKGFYFYV